MEELKKGQKAFVVGERHNPQLGVNLRGPYAVTVRRVNKTTYSVVYDDDMDGMPTLFLKGSGASCLNSTCAYGSIYYHLHSPASAADLFERFAEAKHRDDYADEAKAIREKFQ